MPLDVPAGSYKPDAGKIFELINVWDHRCPAPGNCPHPPGAVTRFARSIGRHPQTLWNLRGGKLVSATLINQLAAVLHIEVAEITLPKTAGTETPRPQAAVRKAA